MKKVILMAAGIVMSANVMSAQILAKVVQESSPISANVTSQVPVKSCRIEQVPVYANVQTGSGNGKVQPSMADKAVGAIFGGLIGNQVGGGSGKQAATMLGIVMGAEMVNGQLGGNGQSGGSSKRVVTGYNNQEVCQVVTKSQTVQRISGYGTYIEFGNQIWQLTTPVSYSKGDFMKINVDVSSAQ
jgi:uncharacterized protein YcfJ